MTNKAIVPAVLALTLLAACMSPRKPGEHVHLYGDPAPPVAATRTIVIHPDTRYVNVDGGEIVRFVVDGKEFGWMFNVARTVSAFDLSEVAPPGVLTHSVQAYVAPDTRYYSGP